MKTIANYQNGNTHVELFDDGTLIRTIPDNEKVVVDFPSSMDIKITNWCDANCSFCHEKSTISGQHGDLEKLKSVLKDLPPGCETAIGGGNPLSHPNIYDFLVWVKQKGIITNITINQKHVKSDFDMIKKLIEEDLVKGIGISYTSSVYLPDIAEVMKLTDNLVFHIIMGVNKLDDINQLMNFCDKQNKKCKILVLGYKEYGFGLNYYLKNKKIEDVKYSWYTGLANFFNKDLVLSFDNLALKQLDLKRFFTEESWNSFFMGDDGVYTMYIDAVSQTFAKSSTSNNRKSFDDIKLLDFFKQLSEENNV